MASTNKTANLKLSQYVNSDKPSYLQDYNEDMRKIDEFSKNALQKDSGWVVVNIANDAGFMCYRRIGKIVYFFLNYIGTKTNFYFDFDEVVPLGFRPSQITISQSGSSTSKMNSLKNAVGFNNSTSAICRLRYGYEENKIGLVNTVSGQNSFNVAINTVWVTDDDFPEN